MLLDIRQGRGARTAAHERRSGTPRTAGLRRTAAGAVLATAVATGGVVWAASPAAADGAPVTYQGHTYSTSVSAPSADKPQSKVWRQDGAWWSVMTSASTALPTIHELLANHTWRDTGVAIDSRSNSTADVDNYGDVLYGASRTSSGSITFTRWTYVPASRSYVRASGFPVTVATGGSESVSFTRDTTGMLWMTWTKSSRVYMSHTTTSETAWTPQTLVPVPDNTIGGDDISGIVSFSNKVGIMWSDQQSAAVRFAVHTDGRPDTEWAYETVLSGGSIADDHMNLKSLVDDSQGRVFAAVKTSNTGATEPLIIVLKRASNGTWTSATAARVQDDPTRPQIVLDNEQGRLYLLMTAPTSGGTIYYKWSGLDTLSFGTGRGTPFMTWSGAKINNVSTTKDAVNSSTGLVAIAADSGARRYYHAEMTLGAGGGGGGGDTTDPTAPASLTATPVSPTTVNLSWPAGSDNVGVTGYQVFRNGTQIGATTGALTFSDTEAAPSTAYTYGVRARDAAGNVSTLTTTTATTPPADGGGGDPSGPITFRAGTTFQTGAGTALTAGKPAGLAAGDVMLASVSVRGNPTITAPAGWTLVNQTVNGNVMRQAVYVKAAGASEPASYTFTLSQSKAAVLQVDAWSGVSTTTPVMSATGQLNASSNVVTAPSATAGAGDLAVAVFGTGRASDLVPAGGLTERTQDISSTGSSKVSAAMADRAVAAAGSVGPFTATSVTGGAASVGQTVVLNAA